MHGKKVPLADFLKQDVTQRGFGVIAFEDRYGVSCSLQESSASDPAVWFGVNDPDPQIMAVDALKYGIDPGKDYGWVPYPVPPEVLMKTRMHLNQEQVAALLTPLQHFVDTGYLPTYESEPMKTPVITVSTDNGATYEPAPNGVRVKYEGVDLVVDEVEKVGMFHINHSSEGLVFDLFAHESEGDERHLGTRSLMIDDLEDFVIHIEAIDTSLVD